MTLINDVLLELDLTGHASLISNPSGEFGLAAWRDYKNVADRSDITDVNEKNGTLEVRTDVSGDPYFRGIPAANTPVHAKYRTNYMRIKPWKGGRKFEFGAELQSPTGGATHADVYVNFYDASFNLVTQTATGASLTPGAGTWTTARSATFLSSSLGIAWAEIVVLNDTASLANKTLYFRKVLLFGAGPDDPSHLMTYDDANTWTNVMDDTHLIRIDRGNSMSGANEKIETGFMSVTLVGDDYSPTRNNKIRAGLRGRLRVFDGTNWRTRFTGELFDPTAHPRLGTKGKTTVQLTFRDIGSYLTESFAPAVLYNGSYRQRVAQALDVTLPFVATDSGETQIANSNKVAVTEADDLSKADALQIIRNSYFAIADPGDTYVDRGGCIQCNKGESPYINKRPYLFATRAPKTSSNMAESDQRTNQYSRPNPFQLVDWQLTTPTNTLVPSSTTLGNDQKAWAVAGETLTCQVRVLAQESVRVIPQVIHSLGTASGTAIDLFEGDEQQIIWSRVFDSNDEFAGVKFQLKFEEYGIGGALPWANGTNYAQVNEPVCMVGTWTDPVQYFDGSLQFTTWIDKPKQAGNQSAFFGAWSVRDLVTPNTGIVVDGIELTFDTTSVVNRLKVTHKGVGGETAYGPFLNRASINEWGDKQSDFVINKGDPAVLASYIFGNWAQPDIFPKRVRWNVTESLADIATFDINQIFGVLHDDIVIDCKVLGLTETIEVYDGGAKHKYMVEITPKPYSFWYESADVDVPPATEQFEGGPGGVAVETQNIYNYPAVASMRQTSAQTIGNNGYVAITFTTEDFDSDEGHNNGTNTSRYTFKRDGYFFVGGGVCWAPNAAGQRSARLAKNGVAVDGSENTLGNNGAGTGIVTRTFGLIAASAGDYVELQGWQNSGGNLNTLVQASPSGNQSSMQVYFIRPP